MRKSNPLRPFPPPTRAARNAETSRPHRKRPAPHRRNPAIAARNHLPLRRNRAWMRRNGTTHRRPSRAPAAAVPRPVTAVRHPPPNPTATRPRISAKAAANATNLVGEKSLMSGMQRGGGPHRRMPRHGAIERSRPGATFHRGRNVVMPRHGAIERSRPGVTFHRGRNVVMPHRSGWSDAAKLLHRKSCPKNDVAIPSRRRMSDAAVETRKRTLTGGDVVRRRRRPRVFRRTSGSAVDGPPRRRRLPMCDAVHVRGAARTLPDTRTVRLSDAAMTRRRRRHRVETDIPPRNSRNGAAAAHGANIVVLTLAAVADPLFFPSIRMNVLVFFTTFFVFVDGISIFGDHSFGMSPRKWGEAHIHFFPSSNFNTECFFGFAVRMIRRLFKHQSVTRGFVNRHYHIIFFGFWSLSSPGTCGRVGPTVHGPRACKTTNKERGGA